MTDRIWECSCGWRGTTPHLSDASHMRATPDGGFVMDRVHHAICPGCFGNLSLKEKEDDTTRTPPPA